MTEHKTVEEVRKELSDYGIDWIGGEYNSPDSILQIKCKKGHMQYESLAKVEASEGCPRCGLTKAIHKAETKPEAIQKLPEKKGRRLLSVDQATRITGYAIYEDENLIAYGIVEANQKDEMFARIKYFNRWLANTIKEAKIDAVALEGVQYQGNPKTLIDLSRLLGSLEQTVYNELHREPLGVLASQWKSTCDISGKYRKEQKASAQKFVKDRYGIDASSDAADAICIGHHAVRLSKLNKARSISSNKLAF